MVEQEIKIREVWVDVLRAFACACVLLVHAPIAFDGVTGGSYLLAPSNHFLMAGGVCVFFMISGALLFAKEQTMIPFYKKRFSRVAYPVLFWSVVYILIEACKTGMEVTETLKHIAMVPFASQTGMMWFMYVLCGIYLVVPILSPWLTKATKREVEIVLAIWLFTTLIPYLRSLHPQFDEMIGRTGLLFNLSGFLGYAILGFYLSKFSTLKVKSIKYMFILAFSLCLPVAVFALPYIPKEALRGSCNIAAVSLATAIFIFFKQLKVSGAAERVLTSLAKYSFGIYLCHMLFMDPFKQMIAPYHLHYAIQIPLTAIVVGSISFALVWLLSKMNFSKFLLG